MKKNLGNTDRIIRMVLAVIFVLLWFQNLVTGTAAIILLILAGIFILTSFFGFCPLYKLFNVSTWTGRKAV